MLSFEEPDPSLSDTTISALSAFLFDEATEYNDSDDLTRLLKLLATDITEQELGVKSGFMETFLGLYLHINVFHILCDSNSGPQSALSLKQSTASPSHGRNMPASSASSSSSSSLLQSLCPCSYKDSPPIRIPDPEYRLHRINGESVQGTVSTFRPTALASKHRR